MKTLLMTMRVTEANNYIEKRNSIAYEYIKFFEKLNYMIILVPNNTNNIKRYFNMKINLIVLSGGNNVNPNLYLNKNILDDVYSDRDNVEYGITKLAIDKNIPILGICRGFHFLNIYFKGKLSHNIRNHVNKNHILNSKNHILNKEVTNSFHNQAIKLDDLSKELEILATSEDNILEAFKHREYRILGLQWHPERQNKVFDIKLINKFLEGKI